LLERVVLERAAVVADLGQVPLGELVGVDDQVAAPRQVLDVGLQRGGVHRDEDVRRVARREDVVVGELQLEARYPGERAGRARISAGKFGMVDRSLPKTAVSWVNLSPASCMPSPESPANLMMT
jgi:hypothetical protein